MLVTILLPRSTANRPAERNPFDSFDNPLVALLDNRCSRLIEAFAWFNAEKPLPAFAPAFARASTSRFASFAGPETPFSNLA